MAVTDNKIGDFDFISLNGNVNAPAEQLVIDQRIGIDGTEITQTGKRALPSILRSHRDVEDLAAGRRLYREYLDSIQDNPVEVIKDGESSLDGAWKGQAIEVQLIYLGGMSGSVGGLEDNPAAFLICEWTIIAIAN
jgi:hypothetical protein